MYRDLISEGRDAVTYLYDSDRFADTLVAGGIYTTFSSLVVPAIIVMGYHIRILRWNMIGKDGHPTFDDGMTLVKKGAMAYFITGAYFAIPGLFTYLLQTQGEIPPGKVTLGILGLFLLGPFSALSLPLVLGVIAPDLEATVGLPEGSFLTYEPYIVFVLIGYILPAALANFAQPGNGRLRDGFDVRGALTPVLRDPRYTLTWLIAVALLAVGWLGVIGIEAVATRFLPIGALGDFSGLYLKGVAALMAFYLQASAFALVGTTWRSIHGEAVGNELASGEEGVRSQNRAPDRSVRGSVTYLWNGGDFFGKAIYGTVLVWLSTFVIPGLLLAGYLVRVLRQSIEDRRGVPNFDDWPRLFADGVGGYAIWLVYLFVPTFLLEYWLATSSNNIQVLTPILGTIGIEGPGVAELATTLAVIGIEGMGFLAGLPATLIAETVVYAVVVLVAEVVGVLDGGWTLFAIALVLQVVGILLVPAALLRYAATGRLQASFRPSSLRRLIMDRTYLSRWIAGFGVSIVGWAVVFPGLLVPVLRIVGRWNQPNFEQYAVGEIPFFAVMTPTGMAFYAYTLVAALVYFYALVTAFRLVGTALASESPYE